MRGHALERIVFSVDRTSRLVRQLLTLVREEGRVRDSPPPRISLSRVLDEIAQTYGPLADAKGVTLDIAQSCRDLSVTVEAEVLALAIGNLVENAILHGAANGTVHVTCVEQAGLEIRVTDDGPGIAPDEWERLRRRFERGMGTDVPGSGLGLSIAEAAIVSAGGSLELRSAEPHGLVAEIHVAKATDPLAC